MLYFQLSEPEYNSLRRVQDQLGLISSLIIGAYPGHALEPVTPGQLLAFIQAQEEALEGVMGGGQRARGGEGLGLTGCCPGRLCM
ncbi:hypothetical protein [Delftia acidovorans]|uniref:hypothetical protein n=2 Tax=Delftia TaxID=80865 RepID=UPI0024315ECA|nr:hypothetical protein [Delftia acidovorans]